MCIRDRSYAVIILITTNQEAFLPTILSRCVQLKLKPLKDFTVKSYLTEHLDIPEKEAEICAAFARGNLGKAIHLASSDEFKELFQKVMNIVKKMCIRDRYHPLIMAHAVTSFNLARLYDIPYIRFIPFVNGDEYDFDSFKIQVVPGRHNNLVPGNFMVRPSGRRDELCLSLIHI